MQLKFWQHNSRLDYVKSFLFIFMNNTEEEDGVECDMRVCIHSVACICLDKTNPLCIRSGKDCDFG